MIIGIASSAAGRHARGALTLGFVIVLGWASPAAARDPVVFAAASLMNALDEVFAGATARCGARATVSHAASSTLARQIEGGAPADIFVSADVDWMNYLDRQGLLRPGTRYSLLRNEIVLVAPAASRTTAVIAPGFPLLRLLGDGRLAIGDPGHVPAGKYARAALESLGVWRSVSGRLAPGENVRAALNFVSRGEAPLGIVYRTDAAADPNVRIVATFPPDSHPPVVYPAAMLVTGKSPLAAACFEYLKSPVAADVFRRHGFAPFEKP